MAYKCQLGSAVLSGALTQEGTFEVKDDDGLLRYSVNRDTGLVSGSGMLIVNDSAYFKGSRTEVSGGLTTLGNSLFKGELDIFGRLSGSGQFRVVGDAHLKSTLNVSGAATFGSTIAAVTDGNSLGATTFNDKNITSVGNIALDSISADGAALSIDSDWDAAGVACSDIGTVATGIYTSVDINGGTIDATAIGATTQSTAKVSSLSASLDLLVQARTQLKSTLNVSGAATFASSLSGASTLTVVGATTLGRNNGATTFSGSAIRFYGLVDDTDFAQATDSLFYYDVGSKSMKRQTNAQYLDSIKGTGLTVSAGKLNVEEAGTTVIRWGNASVTLLEGFNVGTASLSENRTWTLPSGSAINDRVHVKRADGAGILTIAKGSALEAIDGLGSVLLESPSGSVSLVYIAHNRWSIY
jgi:hypothetical protein